MLTRIHIAIIAGTVFFVGAGTIVYYGRPVMKLNQNASAPVVQDSAMPVPSEQGKVDEMVVENENEIEDEAEDEAEDTGAPVASPTPTPAPAPTPAPTPKPTPAPAPAPAPTPAPGTYSMADVQAHGTSVSCWTTINGNVYDVTEWVSRHPGGPDKIIGICGLNATTKFNNKHGSFQTAIDTLALYKIGTLR